MNLRLNLRLLLLLLLRSLLLGLLLLSFLGLLSSGGGKVHLLHSTAAGGHHHRLLLLLLTLLNLLLLIWMRSSCNLNRLPVDGRRADNVRMMGTRRGGQLKGLRPHSRTTAHSRRRPRGDNGRLDVPAGRISDLNRLNLPGLVVMEGRGGYLYRLRRSRWMGLTTSRLDHLQPLRRLEGQLRGHSHRLLLLLLLLKLHLLLLLLLLLKLLLLLLLLDINRRLSLAAGDVVPERRGKS